MNKEDFEKAKRIQSRIDDLERRLKEINGIERLGAIKIISVNDHHKHIYVDGREASRYLRNLSSGIIAEVASLERKFAKL